MGFTQSGRKSRETTRVFDDPYRIEQEEQTSFYEEARYHAIGMVENLLLFVAFTYRQDNIRLISARKVTPRERRQYHEVCTGTG
jgi:uncharacterized DUF497 family protein